MLQLRAGSLDNRNSKPQGRDLAVIKADESDTDQAGGSPALVDGAALWMANQKRLARVKAEMARVGEKELRDFFHRLTVMLTDVFGNPKIMDDPEAQQILANILGTTDFEILNYELSQLSDRLAILAEQLTGNSAGVVGGGSGSIKGKPFTATSTSGLDVQSGDRLRIRL
jgi:adhesin HecA-like repeat protein